CRSCSLRRVAGISDMTGQQDLGRITADVGTVLVQHVARPRELVGRAANVVPVLREPRRSAERALLPAAADADRRPPLVPGRVGLHRGSVSSYYWPLSAVVSCGANSPVITSQASSNRSPRSPGVPSSRP